MEIRTSMALDDVPRAFERDIPGLSWSAAVDRFTSNLRSIQANEYEFQRALQ
jgi:hypothetical protein